MIDPRKEKRAARKCGSDGDMLYVAFMIGQCAATAAKQYGKERRNPYPPGKRHDAWENGYAAGDDDGSDWNNN